MTYNTPELLSIGAAQNLVLGSDPKSVFTRNYDDVTHPDGYNDDIFLEDGTGW